jgi:hypothetical protein
MVCGKFPPHPPALKRSSQYHSTERFFPRLQAANPFTISGYRSGEMSPRRDVGYRDLIPPRQQQKTSFFIFFVVGRKPADSQATRPYLRVRLKDFSASDLLGAPASER